MTLWVIYYVIISHKGLKYRFLSSFKGKLLPNDFFVKIKSNLTIFMFPEQWTAFNRGWLWFTVVKIRFIVEFTVKYNKMQ